MPMIQDLILLEKWLQIREMIRKSREPDYLDRSDTW